MDLFVFYSYIIAVLLGHVEAEFPYISDAATYAPESCIFAQFINMIAMLSECPTSTNVFKSSIHSEEENRLIPRTRYIDLDSRSLGISESLAEQK